MTEDKTPLTADEKAVLESQEISEMIEASRERGGRNPRPSKRLNDLTDGEQVIEL